MVSKPIKFSRVKAPIPVFLLGDTLAFYDPKHNRIFYNRVLDEFPDLRGFVLAHEEKHRSHPNNYFKHVWVDVRDYVLIRYHKDFMSYTLRMLELQDKYSPKPHNFFHASMMIIYTIVNVVLNVFMMLFDGLLLLYYSLKSRKKKEKDLERRI